MRPLGVSVSKLLELCPRSAAVRMTVSRRTTLSEMRDGDAKGVGNERGPCSCIRTSAVAL